MTGTPHDALFKAVFSEPTAAAAELQAVLPAGIASRIDFGSLRLEPGSFVDESLRSRHSDLLFSARISGRDARIYLLFEHRSSPDPLLPFRLLVYEVRIWEAILAREPFRKRLPVVLPVVVHHGAAGWNAATSLIELFDLDDHDRPIFAPALPQLRFVLDDLASHGRHELFARALPAGAKLALLALRDVRDASDLYAWMRSVAEIIRTLVAEPQGRQAFATIIKYILLTRSRTDVERLVAEAERIAIGAGEPIMTTARQLIEQGIEQGIERGIEQGIERGGRSMLTRLLTLRFGAPPDAVRERIERASSAELERWADRVLTASSIEDVLRG